MNHRHIVAEPPSLVRLPPTFANGTEKKWASSPQLWNDVRFDSCLPSAPALAVRASEWRGGGTCMTGSGFGRNGGSTRTGATEVIKHIVMWKLHSPFAI
ncbi:hypothetical protein [Burkholderia pseudomultivorans]|uniref:hypothetical protein n=1 Tax=Burkholderia pseudomultivorans TaxID=1207504 RepID=UPI00188F5041|nr:hypothetical protein [Burkholderia pseudomultivorans]MBF5012021.1 hypothetical protein [Burkholderia pseudomultivorans]